MWFFSLSKSIFQELQQTQYLYLLSVYALASILGLISFFAPSGLGVVEGILIYSLKLVIPAGAVIAIIVLTRLWRVSGELSMVGLFFV